MMATNLYAVLGVEKSATDAELKSAYRILARKLHPDVNPSKSAEDQFKQVTSAYEVLSDRVKRAMYDRSGSVDPIIISSKRMSYKLDSEPISGDIADVYRVGDAALKVVRAHSDNDLMQREATVLKDLFKKDKPSARRRYFPELVESFNINNGSIRRVNVFKWISGTYSLSHIRNTYTTSSPIRFEHGVWMLNRMLEGLDYLHTDKGLVHGSIIPPHILVHPDDHGATIVDFTACVPVGSKICMMSPSWEAFYPPEVALKKSATKATDIYMAVKCAIYILGGDPKTNWLPPTVPKYLVNFMTGCLFQNQDRRPQDALALHEELKETMLRHYGPSRFIPLKVIAS